MIEACAVILNTTYEPPIHPENVVYCGKPGVVPMRLPSGTIVAWCCEQHRTVAVA